MKRFQPKYRQTLQKAARLSIAVLVSLSVLSTGVSASVVCNDVCCMDSRGGHHTSGNGMKISKLPQPCCCAGEYGDPCQTVETDKYPVIALADSAARYQRNIVSFDSAAGDNEFVGDSPGLTAESNLSLSVRPDATPLYLSTLAMLC